MVQTYYSVYLLFTTQVSSTFAWGSLGHETVAFNCTELCEALYGILLSGPARRFIFLPS